MIYMKSVTQYSVLLALTLGLQAQALQHQDLMWGLKNTGQNIPGRMISIDLYPSQTYRLTSVAGQDIHLAAPQVGKKIKVAVVDTGLDLNHPDLKNYVYSRKEQCDLYNQFMQCQAARTDTQSNECRDQFLNAAPQIYPADCHGWSTLNIDLPMTANHIIGSPDFTDADKHGTHVAGTILSVTQNVEIIPVQVIGVGPNQPIRPFSIDLSPSEDIRQGFSDPNNLSERVSRGIIYAMNAGAQVINLSLGWNPGQNSQIILDAIAEAQRRGIIIVAAAGNDSTNALLRPCQFKGVICVAAHRPDGALASFSNYGYGVDIAAPGIQILSTIPMDRRSIGLPGEIGYDYLTGTSQAAPFVTGVVAEMLSRGIPANEIYARLILGARPVLAETPVIVGPINSPGVPVQVPQAYQKTVLSGLLDMTNALNAAAQPLILPADKEIHLINWDRRSKNISFQFALKNYWKSLAAGSVSVEVKPTRVSEIEPVVVKTVAMNDKTPSAWSSQQEKTYQVNLEIRDQKDPSLSRMPSDLSYQVAVMINGKLHRQFEVKAEVVVNFTQNLSDSEIMTYPVVGERPKGMQLSLVDEVYDAKPQERDYLLAGNDDSKPNAFKIALVKFNQGRYIIGSAQSIDLDGDINMIRVQYKIRMDIDLDGHSEYIYGIVEYLDKDLMAEGPYRNHFFIFDENMNLKQHYKFDDRRAVLPYVFYWMRVGNSLRPAWVGRGQEVRTSWDVTDLWSQPHNNGVIKDVKTPSGIHFYYLDENFKLAQVEAKQNGKIVDVIQPTAAQQSAGILPLLIARNQGSDQNPSYINEFSVATIQNGTLSAEAKLVNLSQNMTYRNLIDTYADRALCLSQSRFEYQGMMWSGLDAHQKQRVTFLDLEQRKIYDQLMGPQRPIYDAALSVRAGFQSKTRRGAFILTNSEIEYHDMVSQQVATRSLDRYSIFGQSQFDILQLPTTLLDRTAPGEKLPALFTTSNSGLARGVQFKVPIYNKAGGIGSQLVSPARLHINVDRTASGCFALDAPLYLGEQSGYAMDYFCGTKMMRVLLRY